MSPVVAFLAGGVQNGELGSVMSNHAGDESNAQTADADSAPFRELVRTLNNAYDNAITHKVKNLDFEAADLLLENASIHLSSRMLSAMTQDSCHRNDSEPIGPGKCAMDDESVHLRDLTDMLSYAANRLQQIAVSSSPRNTMEPLQIARIRSMEHLYRMTFAISKAHFDTSQSSVYFQAAREQLTLARNSLQMESDLCACASKGYSGRLLELSEVDQILSQMHTNDSSQ